jgi:hypothetical protein
MDVRMINAIWESVLHCVEEWQEAVRRGKVLLENNEKDLEACFSALVLFTQSGSIVRLRWHEHTLLSTPLPDPRHPLVLQLISSLLQMFSLEFDLKVCISSQFFGTSSRRRLLLYIWTAQPHVSDSFLNSLPKLLS